MTHNEYNRLWAKEWRKKNPEKAKASWKKSYKKRSESKEFKLANKERAHVWYIANKEKAHRRNNQYKKLHPDVVQVYTAKRRALKKNAPGSFTPQEWADVVLKQNNKCALCEFV
jgi:hypothetical protein